MQPEPPERWRQLLSRIDGLRDSPNHDLIRGLLESISRLSESNADRRDMKMAHLALRESCRAMALFSQYRNVPKVSVFGSARTDPSDPTYQLAVDFSREICSHGFMVMTGAGGGIMEAAQLGAGAERSFGLNIDLPFEQHANATIEGDPKLVDFRFFFTRKLFFLKETRALALFPGGFGTLDEGFEALTLIQTGKSTPMPIVLMESEGGGYWHEWREYLTEHLLARGLIHKTDLTLFKVCHTVADGVAEIARFFRVFHSSYRTHDGVSIWLWRSLEDDEIAFLNDGFSGMMGGSSLSQLCVPGPVESDTVGERLSCIHVPMDHRFQGRLRQFIDALNNL